MKLYEQKFSQMKGMKHGKITQSKGYEHKYLETSLYSRRYWLGIRKNVINQITLPVYLIELALKLSPMPVSVQRKTLEEAESIYQQIRQCLEQGHPKLLELTCDKVEDKKVTLLVSEVLAVQIYEKTAATGGMKRPGFSLDA